MKPTLPPIQVVTSGDMSGSITSQAQYIGYFDNVCIQLDFTGTPTGTFAVEVSANHQRNLYGEITNAGDWIALALPTTPTASGAADHIAIDVNQCSFPYIRVVYTRGSGSGTLNALIGGKMI